MKTIIKGFAIIAAFFILASCTKEDMKQQCTCDLNEYTGSWRFIVDGDPSTEYVGQIDKFNYGTLNITYQPSTAYDYFFQMEVNCEDGMTFKQMPAGNHGTTTIEGVISLTDFVYKDSTYINYTGQPQITVKTIVGTKI